jgi:hypothetical protein
MKNTERNYTVFLHGGRTTQFSSRSLDTNQIDRELKLYLGSDYQDVELIISNTFVQDSKMSLNKFRNNKAFTYLISKTA